MKVSKEIRIALVAIGAIVLLYFGKFFRLPSLPLSPYSLCSDMDEDESGNNQDFGKAFGTALLLSNRRRGERGLHELGTLGRHGHRDLAGGHRHGQVHERAAARQTR